MSSDAELNPKLVEAQTSVNITKRDEITPDKNSKSKQTKSSRKRKR